MCTVHYYIGLALTVYAGSFPLEINLASLGVGDYTLTVSADGIFNTTDETSISFSGTYFLIII